MHVDAPAECVYSCLWSADLAAAPVTRTLFAIRGGHFSKPVSSAPLTLRAMSRAGFTLLDERPGDQILFGLIGRPWQPAYEIRRFEASEFIPFDESGYAKIVWNFAVQAESTGTRLSTQTRVRCTDRASLIKFQMYWLFTGPFSSFIRRQMLRSIAACASADS
ncbi:MAG: hypothetical protein JO219_09475 [Candidatus Eremiobacteraeota bacterium]|nr:hypothetical protein [Candidatus Eremiobacteraeota bacterium]MBV8366297.1 hypothetical protein [Candidatus Eremiobacteraeota bacterium]